MCAQSINYSPTQNHKARTNSQLQEGIDQEILRTEDK